MASIMTKLLWQCYTGNAYRKSNFFITLGCLVSEDQPTINYKSSLRRILTQTLDFSQILMSYDIRHSIGLCICSYGFMGRRNTEYETYKQDTLSMSNAVSQCARLNH